MYQFFIEDEQVHDTYVTIEGTDVNHIRNVLRMKKGEKIRVSSRSGMGYFCEVDMITEQCVEAKILSLDETGTELSSKISLYQGLPKSDKMELIIQKAVELGVYEVIPVAMKNCVVKLDEKKAASKVKRWQSIAESAAKQSKRSLIPEVVQPMSYKQALERAQDCDRILIPYENERGMLATKEAVEAIEPGESVAIFIGPEGGFAPEEITNVGEKAKLISLGKRILRTETAGLATLAILGYQLESKEG